MTYNKNSTYHENKSFIHLGENKYNFNLKERYEGFKEESSKFIKDINREYEELLKDESRTRKKEESKPDYNCVESFLCRNMDSPNPSSDQYLIHRYNRTHPFFKNCFNEQSIEGMINKWSYFSSPFVCKVVDYFLDSTQSIYIVFEYYEGSKTLSEIVRTNGKELTKDELKNIFRQVSIAINHATERKLYFGLLTLDNIRVDLEKIRGKKGYQEGVTVYNYNFGLKWNVMDSNFLPPEVMERSHNADNIWSSLTDNYSLGVCIYKTITMGKSPFSTLKLDDLIRQKKSNDFNFYDQCFHDKEINLKDLIYSLMDGESKSRHDVAIKHLYFENKYEPDELPQDEDHNLQAKDSMDSNDYGIFDFLFRNYLFRKYEINNMRIIRDNFLEIDYDFSGDISEEEYIEKGMQVHSKSENFMREKYNSFRKFCSIIDYDAYVCSNAEYKDAAVLDYIRPIYKTINQNYSADCSLIEVYKWIKSRTNSHDYSFEDFQADIRSYRDKLAYNDIYYKRPYPNAIYNSGIYFLEFARIFFKVFFPGDKIIYDYVEKFNKVIMEGYAYIYFHKDSQHTSISFKNFVRFISWHDLDYEPIKIAECIQNMNDQWELKQDELEQIAQEKGLTQVLDKFQGFISIKVFDVKEDKDKSYNIIYRKLFMLIMYQNMLYTNIPDIIGFYVNFKDCILNYFIVNNKIKEHCYIKDNLIRVTRQLQNYQYIIMEPVLDYRTQHFHFRMKVRKYSPKNFGCYLALMNLKNLKIYGLNLSGPTYNMDFNSTINLDFQMVKDGDILDLIWTTTETEMAKKAAAHDNQKISEEAKKLKDMRRKLTITWYYNNIRIAEFKTGLQVDPKDDNTNFEDGMIADNKFKLVMSIMHQGDEFEILMI